MTLKPKENSVKEKRNPMNVLKQRKSLVEKASEDLEEKGVVFFSPDTSLNIDTDYLTLPEDITDISSKELGKFLNAYTQHRMYMRTLIGWQMMYLEESKRVYYEVSTPIYSTLTKKDYPSETAKERHLNNHPDVVEFFEKYKDEKRKADLLNLNLASIDDAIFLVSREISRRGNDFEVESRNESVQNK